MYIRLLLSLVLLPVACSVGFAESFSVTIKAIDAATKPVAKADIAIHWDFQDGDKTSAYPKDIVTDADGRAVLVVDNWNEKRPVLVLSADRKLGGIVGVSKEDDGKEVVVTLGPTVRVKGKLVCKELNAKPEWVNTIATADGFRAGAAQNISKSAQINLVLPVGKYRFHIYGTDFKSFNETITLSAANPEHDLGTIDLKASPIATMKGKSAADLVIADARGVKKDMKLSDFKGKWVYVEFWGFW